MPVPSLVDVATRSAKTLVNKMYNLDPAAPFATVGDDTLRDLTDLSRIFTTAITPTVAPVPAATDPTLLVAPSQRVTDSPSPATSVTSSALSPRVMPNYTPPLPHLIAPDNDKPVPLCRYTLQLRPQRSLSECGPH